MKTLVHLAMALAAIFTSTGGWSQTSLEVSVKNIRNTNGSIRVALFTNAEDFLKKAVKNKVLKVEGSEMTVLFEGLEPGDYAISIIHDENDNGGLDSNAIGIPREGFGFSNNARGMFGPPSFEKAKITLNSGANTTTISLVNL